MQVIRTSSYDEFWPTGWMVWACGAIALLDVSLIAFVIRCATRIFS